MYSTGCRVNSIFSSTATPNAARCNPTAMAQAVGGRMRRSPVSNSGQHLAESLRSFNEPRRLDGERNAKKSLGTGAERRAGKRHHAAVLARTALELRRPQALGQ